MGKTNGKPLGNFVIGLSMEGTEMANTLDEIKRVTKMATSEMKANLSVLGAAGDQYAKNESKISGLTKVMTSQEKELEALNKKHKEAVDTYGENSKEAQKYANQINNVVKRQAAYTKELSDAKIKQEEFKRGTQDMKKEIELMERSTNSNISTLKSQNKEVSASVLQLKSLKEQREKQAKVIQDEKAKLNDLIEAKGKDNLETKEQAAVLDEAIAKHSKMGQSIDDLDKKYGKMSDAQAAFKDNVNETQEKIDSFADKTNKLGKNITTKVSLPIAAGFTAAAKSSVDFETAITGVYKTVDGTDAELKKISDGVREMALVIPAGTTEIAGVAEAAGQLGIKTPSILGFTRSMIDMGQATNLTAEDAAMQLAKFANVTKMNQKDFDRLGSSVVDLGNNFATTESDIVAMASRLAGAGSQVGLSEADIMGLSAALSSVGVEAEMGGSAFSKVMVNMQVATKTGLTQLRDLEKATGMTRRELELMQNLNGKGFKEMAAGMGKTTTELGNILKAGKNLESFGAIAGMTAEQFKQAFEKDAVGAIGSFVNGLGTAEEKGTSAIELLDEMGIREVRLRDSLLKAGNANELFTNAVQQSNKAWSENTALTKEAETRYATTQSKISLMLNTLKEFGIQIGEILLPTVNKLVDTTTKWLRKFNDLDDGTKRLIVKTGMLTMTIGPLILGVSKTASAFSLVTKHGGNATMLLNLFSKNAGVSTLAARSMTAGVGATTTAMSGLSAGTAVTGASLMSILGPVALVAGGVVALSAAVLYGTKKYAEYQREQDKVDAKIEKFGSNVSDSTAKAADSFVTMRDQAKVQLDLLETATDENGKKISSKIVENYSGMATEVVKAISKTRKETVEALNGIKLDVGAGGDEWLSSVLNQATTSYDKDVEDVEKAKNRINELLKEVGGNLQNLNATQKQEFDSLKGFIDEHTGVFASSYKDQERLLEAWNERKETLSEKSYEKEQTNAKKMRDKAIKAAEDDYKKGSKAITKAYDSGAIKSKEDFDGLMSALNVQRNKQQAKANASYAQTDMALSKHIENTGKLNLQTLQSSEDAKTYIQGMGYKYFDQHTKKMYDSESEWIKATKKHNDEYVKNSKELSGATVKNLNAFEKSQKEIYETIGLLPGEAAKRAKEDRQKIEDELTKAGTKMSAVAKKIHDDYVGGLKGADDGQIAEVAKSWGLDLAKETDLIDFGKYGQKTAKQFFDDFKSGSEMGAAEAKIYFKTKLESITEVDLAKIGEENISSLRQGLLSGSVTFDALADKFGKTIIGLFPNDLNALGQLEVDTLKKGLESGQIDSQELKNKFSEQYENLFNKNLTDLGADEIETLKKGLEIGLYSKDDLKTKYAEQLNGYFKQDLSQLSKDSMETLKVGFELGVPGAKNKMEAIAKLVKDSATIDLGEKGKFSMKTLVEGYEQGKLTIDEFMNGYSQFMNDKSKLNLNSNGEWTVNQYANGMEVAKPNVEQKATDVFKVTQAGFEMTEASYGKGTAGVNSLIQGMIDRNAEAERNAALVRSNVQGKFDPLVGLLYQTGSNGVLNLAQGIIDKNGNAGTNANLVFQNVQSNLEMGKPSYDIGVGGVTNLAQGIIDKTIDAEKNALNVSVGVTKQYNKTIDSSNDLSKKLGSDAKLDRLLIPGFKTGTKGALKSATHAFVGDGGEHELIDYGNGKMAMSPDTTTLTHLPAGATVYNGGQTKEILKMMNQASSIPMFAKGTGGSVLDWFGGKMEGLFEFISKPLELWKKVVHNSFDLSTFKGDSGKNIGTGAQEFANARTDWIQKLILSSTVSPPGAGAERWRPMVGRALAMNGLPTSDDYVSAWVRQIDSETGGNEKAVQGGYVDVNTLSGDLAKGLLQTISATFNANKLPGHGDIFNGFDNMLAAMNYAKNRYGASGMLGVIGHGHGYANGGIVSQHQIAQIAEGNKPEAIIPLDPLKRTRAMQLLAKANQIVGFDSGSQVVVNHDNSDIVSELKVQNILLQRQTTALQSILRVVSERPEKTNELKGIFDLFDKTTGERARLEEGGIIT